MSGNHCWCINGVRSYIFCKLGASLNLMKLSFRGKMGCETKVLVVPVA